MGKMRKIIGLFKSPSTSISSPGPAHSPTNTRGSSASTSDIGHPDLAPRSRMESKKSSLEGLPTEIINHILGYLPPLALAVILRTSHHLRAHAENDLLWMRIVHSNVPDRSPILSPSPAKSWRELYAVHHPYWFLTRHKIWFSDKIHSGSLILARYDPRRGCIEAYRMLATHTVPFDLQQWERDPDVVIHIFKPEVTIMTDDPVINLPWQSQPQHCLSGEVTMKTGQTPGIASMLSLCTPISPYLLDPSMALWPPRTIPSTDRVRNESPNMFRADAHRPSTWSDASDTTFRLRKYLQWSNLLQPLTSIRMGEEVSTFSTLPEECYTPTQQKPYQGIFVGDYAAHGCEFLLVTQRDRPTEVETSRRSSTASGLPSGTVIREREADGDAGETPSWDDTAQTAGSEESSEEGPCRRIEAIKLTGDINVPRGECTWFADDIIGDEGLIRVADEEVFKGARVVRSKGQVASSGFRGNRFIESELILIDHDTIAQYWERWGHISFYKRIDMEKDGLWSFGDVDGEKGTTG